MEQEKEISKTNEPISEYGKFSYADYLTWQMEEMVELIKGKVFKQAAAPRVNHQRAVGKIFITLANFLNSRTCEAFVAPFDVRLPVKSRKNEDIDTVVQPDICVVCDPTKIDELGCVGAPDLIVEVLSPGNNRKELKHKYDVYQEAGVLEYWIVQPVECTLMIYTLVNGQYQASKLLTMGDIARSQAVKGFELDLSSVFENINP
ncbi:Uma2 family endonuclease [Mongoliitalea daihaiensis]|uniref:Uma2 family endonuclease n=1 Tax=Mongoliitalea daihaiensis TaxID=2782006 RepID=UPI001F30C648|nr:Uma2 family endonuclease [Mongoliitalea daihaiensis]UJP65412.1 Uma2 family endonuclease [Mongoliitalea daihaiensis]